MREKDLTLSKDASSESTLSAAVLRAEHIIETLPVKDALANDSYGMRQKVDNSLTAHDTDTSLHRVLPRKNHDLRRHGFRAWRCFWPVYGICTCYPLTLS
jgi:hypothetical protein